MRKYNPTKIESKWQKIWEETGLHKAEDFSKKPKYYCLDMFPYPSGEGLHVGHLRGYVLSDVWARYKKLKGFNVLHPMGWDAFGLPAENAAIKRQVHPETFVKKNIEKMKSQLKKIGALYDWSREINTTDPHYYKWTQWIFLQMFKKGLAYKTLAPINWCPSCKTGLANEEVVGGKCERCGTEVEKKEIPQWALKITAYAERLLKDLDKLDWPEKVKIMQKNWIGKSEGVLLNFKGIKKEIIDKLPKEKIKETEFDIPVFTTRIDTIFGVTFLVLAPEHPLVKELTTPERKKEVESYIEKTKKLSEIERQNIEREKTGVWIGATAINPLNNEEIPIWISDYVILGYGTGAVMGVPAHDQRDFDFAKKYGLEIRQVIAPTTQVKGITTLTKAYEGEGYLINSAEFSGLTSQDAREKLADFLESKKIGKRTVQYRLRDWIFSRQRYWGEPIPLVYCPSCAEKIKNKKYKKGEFSKGELLNPGWIALPEEKLPLQLPKVKKYQPTGTGESPLANITDFVETRCPKCRKKARRETDTMPQWAGSCWYFLAYALTNKNLKSKEKDFGNKNFKKLFKYWLPVDKYVGGIEHAILHLLYARFWTKFLYDIKVIDFDEPFLSLFNQGMVYRFGSKMSKSRGNVVSPDELIKKYGMDTLRGYELFMGPPEQDAEWNDSGVPGVFRFLNKVWDLSHQIISEIKKKKITLPEELLYKSLEIKETALLKLIHKTIKKVTEDLERFHFNTVISTLMSAVNELEREIKNFPPKEAPEIWGEVLKNLLLILSPIFPHLAEELWSQLGFKESIFTFSWPSWDEKLIKEESITLLIQIDGKLRDKIEVSPDISEDEAKAISQDSEKIKKHLEGKEIKKIIYVKNRLINIVTK